MRVCNGSVRWRGLAAVTRTLRILMELDARRDRDRAVSCPQAACLSRPQPFCRGALTTSRFSLPLIFHAEIVRCQKARRASRVAGHCVDHAAGAFQLGAPALQPDEKPEMERGA